MAIKRLALVLSCGVLLAACQADEPAPLEVLDAPEAVAKLEDFQTSAWRGCNQTMQQSVRPDEMLDGTAGLPFWECSGVFENSYPYEFALVLNPQNKQQVLFTQLEFRRGHQDSFNALLRYFLRLQGVQNEQQRLDIRSQVTSVIASNPRQREFTPIMFLPDGRQIEMAHNYPKSAFTTLRVRNQTAD